jgi:hypothetical protein
MAAKDIYCEERSRMVVFVNGRCSCVMTGYCSQEKRIQSAQASSPAQSRPEPQRQPQAERYSQSGRRESQRAAVHTHGWNKHGKKRYN